MYMMVCTMPDIEYVVGLVSRYMSNLGKEHWVAVKWILQYLKGTLSVCLWFGSGKPLFEGFIDSDMSTDVDTSRSTSRYVMTYTGEAVLWQLRLQKSVALSTTEAEEYMADKEVIWMKDFVGELGIQHDDFQL